MCQPCEFCEPLEHGNYFYFIAHYTEWNGTLIEQLSGTYLSFAEPAGFRLLNAFNHLVFIEEELEEDILRSPRGEPGSILPKNNSFCNEKKG